MSTERYLPKKRNDSEQTVDVCKGDRREKISSQKNVLGSKRCSVDPRPRVVLRPKPTRTNSVTFCKSDKRDVVSNLKTDEPSPYTVTG